MKRNVCVALFLALLFALCLSTAASAEGETLGYVTDSVGLLSQEELADLNGQAENLSQTYGCGVYIVILDDYRSYNNRDIETCAEELYRYFDLGYGEERDGILFLMSVNQREFDLAAYGSFGNYAFTDYGKDVLEDSFLPNFRYDEWYRGFCRYLSTTDDLLSAARSGNPVDISGGSTVSRGMPFGFKLAIILGIPCLIAFAVCAAFKAQMKNAVVRTTADEYVIPHSTKLHICQDQFLNRTESVQIIAQNRSSGGGGGGGTTIHASGFSHHSGKF